MHPCTGTVQVLTCFCHGTGCPGSVLSGHRVLATCSAHTQNVSCEQAPTGTKASPKPRIPSLLPDSPISTKEIGGFEQKHALPRCSFFIEKTDNRLQTSPPSPATPGKEKKERAKRRETKSNLLYYLLAGNVIPSDSCSRRLWKSLHSLFRTKTGMRDSSEREFLSTAQPSYRAQTKYFYPVNLVN